MMICAMDWRMWLMASGEDDVDAGKGPGYQHSNLVLLAAEQGDGVALARSVLVQDALAAGRLVKPFDITMPTEYAYYMVCPHENLEQTEGQGIPAMVDRGSQGVWITRRRKHLIPKELTSDHASATDTATDWLTSCIGPKLLKKATSAASSPTPIRAIDSAPAMPVASTRCQAPSRNTSATA